MMRITEAALSSRYAQAQQRLGELAHECQRARREGRCEDALLVEAQELRPGRIAAGAIDRTGADGLWFISRSLLSRRDRRGLRYALRYVRRRPYELRGWLSTGSGVLTAWTQGETIIGPADILSEAPATEHRAAAANPAS